MPALGKKLKEEEKRRAAEAAQQPERDLCLPVAQEALSGLCSPGASLHPALQGQHVYLIPAHCVLRGVPD